MLRKYENQAREFIDAIRTIAKKEENLENLESYLSISFDRWLSVYANDPDGMVSEMKNFAEMEIR